MTTKSCLLLGPEWLGVGVLSDLALVGIVEICYPVFLNQIDHRWKTHIVFFYDGGELVRYKSLFVAKQIVRASENTEIAELKPDDTRLTCNRLQACMNTTIIWREEVKCSSGP